MINFPPGFSTPRLWQQIHYIIDPLGYMDNAYLHYGNIFNAPVMGNTKRLLLVSDPQGLQKLFSHESKEFFSPCNSLLQVVVGDNSLFCLEGEHHRKERRLLMPSFHGERMRSYGQTICELTKQTFNELSLDKTFSARSLSENISLEIILNLIFGIHSGESFYQLKQLMNQFMDSLNSPLINSLIFLPFLRKDLGPWSPWGYFSRLKQKITQLLYALIDSRRTKFDLGATDLLSLLMSVSDEDGQPMSDEQLHDELITLLIAGHDTTATAISWALYWVHQNSQVLSTLRDELDSLGESSEPMSLFKLPYLTAVCNETLRISPVAALTFPREVIEPVELMGYQLEPGTRVYGCIYLTHHREDLYPQPKLFKPERFLDKQYTSYEFFPFGGGSRRCLGEALAIFEMKLVLATIISHYQLALVENQSVKPQRRGVTIAPSGGVKMVFKGHRKNFDQPKLLNAIS